jgi:predicted phage-related endonuclease
MGVVDFSDRRTFLGGSDSAAVMGLGAYGRTAYKVWLSKTSEQPEELDLKQRKFLERRKRFEPQIVAMLREEFDAEIVAVNQRYQDPEHSFLAAELDFEWRDAEGEIQNGEIKTVHPMAFGEQHGWGEPGSDEIPIQYVAQVMHGMSVKRRNLCVVAALIGIDDMVFYRVPRDDDMIATMRAKCIQFWNDHIVPRVPPAPQDWLDMMAMFAKTNGRPVECSEEIAKKLTQLQAIRDSLKAMENEKETLEFEIADFVRTSWGLPDPSTPPQLIDNAELRMNGKAICTWKKQRGSHLDQRGLREAHPDITAAFTKEHWFRPFRFKKS